MIGAQNTVYVQSSTVERITYLEDIETLEIEFKNGSVYQYFDFPEHAWDAYRDAVSGGASAGKFLNDNIKGRFRYSKV